MKKKILIIACIILACCFSGFIGWSIGNPDRAGFVMTIRVLHDRIDALEEIIERGDWEPTAWGLSDGKPLYPVKPRGDKYYYEPVLGCFILGDGTEYHGPFSTYGTAFDDMVKHSLSDGYKLWGSTVNGGEMKYYWSYGK